MNEKKAQNRVLVVLAIAAVVYTIAVFAIPFSKTSAIFWLSWLFTVAACGAQVYVIRSAFFKGQGIKSKFYGFPIARIGVIYLLIQFVLGLIFMALAKATPVWLPLVLYVVLLGAAAVGFIAADAVRDEVERQDTVFKANVTAMRSLQSKAAFIVGQCDDPATKELLQKLSDDLRYSDPVSSSATAETETDLAAYIDELQSAVIDRDYQDARTLCARIETALAERNRICKVSK